MHKNIPFTVQFYKRSRKYNTPVNFPQEIGINFSKPFPILKNLLHDVLEFVFESEAIIQYPNPGGDVIYRQLLAELLNMSIDSDGFSAQNILMTNGSSEGLEAVCKFLQKTASSATLPLPGYFKYQYLTEADRVPISRYYNAYGKQLEMNSSRRSTCIFINNPEAISGKFQTYSFYKQLSKSLNQEVNFTLYDLCYLMLDIDSAISTKDFLSTVAFSTDWEKAALVLSASKDISLPALRAGILISKNEQLLDLTKELIMERYFSISPLSTLTMVIYLALCALWYNKNKMLESNFKEVKYNFKYCGIHLPSFTLEFVSSFQDHLNNLLLSYQKNFEAIYFNYADFFDIENSLIPQSGFSSMLTLRWDNPGIEAIEEIIDTLSNKHNLNIFSSYLFCGTPDIWDNLYPKQIHLRVNSSIERKLLFQWLERLRFHFVKNITNDSRWRLHE